MRTSVRFTTFALVLLTAATAPEEPRPRLLNLHELATAGDYPSVTAANGQEGTAVVAAAAAADRLQVATSSVDGRRN